MAKDPAVLFYTADFISGTITMSDEQRGKYILLLCIQHQKGYLTEKDMLNICKTYDIDIWEKFNQEGDKFFNERMRSETEKRAKYSESRKLNRLKKEKDTNISNDICSTYDEHMVNENENINIDSNVSEKEVQEKKQKPELTLEQVKQKKELEFRAEAHKYVSKYSMQMITEFCNYWTESGPRDRKLRYEKQDAFDISRRLVTWASRAEQRAPSYKPAPQQRGTSIAQVHEIYEELTGDNSYKQLENGY